MKIWSETSLRNFEFWSGACYRVEQLSYEQLYEIENQLEELFPDGINDVELNDLFWFEEDFIAELLGYDSWEDFENGSTDDEDEEEEE